MLDNIFDSAYVEPEKTIKTTPKVSNTKNFLKDVIKTEDLERYGSTKPKRIVIKAKLSSNG